MVIPSFTDAEEARRYYTNKGGLVGIITSLIEKIRTKEKELVEKANEIWRRAFPTSPVVITDARHMRRLIGVFASAAARRRELRPLYEEYRKVADAAKPIADSAPYLSRLESEIQSYKKLIEKVPIPPPATLMSDIRSTIYTVSRLMSRIYSIMGKDVEEEYYLSILFIESEFHLYVEYEATARLPKNYRHIEVIFDAYVHAELLYIEYNLYGKAVGPLFDKILGVFSSYLYGSDYSFIAEILDYSYIGISLSNKKYDYGLKDYPAYIELIDLDYNRVKERYEGMLPWDWPTLSPEDILSILKAPVEKGVQLTIIEFLK